MAMGSTEEAALALLEAARRGDAEDVARLLELAEDVPALFVAADAALASAGEPLRLLHLAARADGGARAMRPGQGTVALLLKRMPAKEVARRDRVGLNPVRALPRRSPRPAWRCAPLLGTQMSCVLTSHGTCRTVCRAVAPRLSRWSGRNCRRVTRAWR